MTYQIERDIPPPPPKATGKVKATLEAMQVGDSAFFHDKNQGSFGGFFQSLKPKRFTARYAMGQDPDGNEVRGMRVWRIE